MEKLKIIFDELEFRTFAKRMLDDASRAAGQDVARENKVGATIDLFSQLDADELNPFQNTNKKTLAETPHEYLSVAGESEIKA